MVYTQNGLFRLYLETRRYERWPDGSWERLTLEGFLAERDDSILPQRLAADIDSLKTLLGPFDADLSGELLRQKLGRNYRKIYSTRDWTDAMKAVLEERHPTKSVKFGKDYRIIFNADGDGGISVTILNEKLIPKRASPPHKKPRYFIYDAK